MMHDVLYKLGFQCRIYNLSFTFFVPERHQMNDWSWVHVFTYTNLFQNISMWSYLLRCRFQKRPKDRSYWKTKNPFLPYLTRSGNPKHTYFLFCPTKHAKHFEKMAELIYAELTQGRESNCLPHTHNFTSLKNVIISALHKIDKRIHTQV